MVMASTIALSLTGGTMRAGIGRAGSPSRTSSRLLAVAAATGNPLLVQTGLPKFESIAAADVKPAMDSVLSSLESGALGPRRPHDTTRPAPGGPPTRRSG